MIPRSVYEPPWWDRQSVWSGSLSGAVRQVSVAGSVCRQPTHHSTQLTLVEHAYILLAVMLQHHAVQP